MRQFKTFAAFPLIVLGIFLACDRRNTTPKNAAPSNTETINLSPVIHSGQTQVFREVKQVTLLPGSVLDQLGAIADPARPFNATDVVDRKLPMQQLVVAAVSEKYCIVSYWRGGIVLALRTNIFQLSEGKAKLILVSNGQGGLNFRDLKDMVESGRIDNDMSTSKH